MNPKIAHCCCSRRRRQCRRSHGTVQRLVLIWTAAILCWAMPASSASSSSASSAPPHPAASAGTTTRAGFAPTAALSEAGTTISADDAAIRDNVGSETVTSSNMLGNLVGAVKTSVTRTIDGTKMLYTNHARCNEIRAKQKHYKNRVKADWEREQDVDPKVWQERVKTLQGGISYEEYVFLQKGKEDRGRVFNLIFLMWGAPRFLPYALMFNPDTLPSPFLNPHTIGVTESVVEQHSRERSSAIIQMLLNMETQAKQSAGKFNFLNGNKAEERRQTLHTINQQTASLLTARHASAKAGAQAMLAQLEPVLYSTTEFSRQDQRLCQVPKCIITGLNNVIAARGFFGSLSPNVLNRGRLVGHVQKIADADAFLTETHVELDTVSVRLLREACHDRGMNVPGATSQELQQAILDWLDLTVHEPMSKSSSLYFNGNLCRTALLTYYGLHSTRDVRSASALPRLLFHDASTATPSLNDKAARQWRRRRQDK